MPNEMVPRVGQDRLALFENDRPTDQNYRAFSTLYDRLNSHFFADQLPRCVITFQRKGATYGYFAAERFGTTDRSDIQDEIALNPTHFETRGFAYVMSTLAHEMVHLWQHHFGDPGSRGYHNREWSRKMHEIGLHPSTTGEVGGKEVGQKCSHYIEPHGPFQAFADQLIADGFKLPYVDIRHDPQRQAKLDSKSKFTCPVCGDIYRAKKTAMPACARCGSADVLCVSTPGQAA
jgi:predicted SprT family Zn-dependent metalloprotease